MGLALRPNTAELSIAFAKLDWEKSGLAEDRAQVEYMKMLPEAARRVRVALNMHTIATQETVQAVVLCCAGNGPFIRSVRTPMSEQCSIKFCCFQTAIFLKLQC